MRKFIVLFLLLCSVCWPATVTVKFGAIWDSHVDQTDPAPSFPFGDATPSIPTGRRVPLSATTSIEAAITQFNSDSVDFAVNGGDAINGGAAGDGNARDDNFDAFVTAIGGISGYSMYQMLGHWDVSVAGTGIAGSDYDVYFAADGMGTVIPADCEVIWTHGLATASDMGECAYVIPDDNFKIIVLCGVLGHATMTTAGVTQGTHTAAGASDTIVTDSAADYSVDGLIGLTLTNITDGSTGTITDNDGTTITVDDLTGGTDDQFEQDDVYSIGWTQQQWFQDVLDVAEAASEPVIVFCHQPLKSEAVSSSGSSQPGKIGGFAGAITSLEAQTIKPVAFQGHVHYYTHRFIVNGVTYFNAQGDVWDAAASTGRSSYAVVDVTYTGLTNRMEVDIQGFGNQRSESTGTSLMTHWKLDEATGETAIIDSQSFADGTADAAITSVIAPLGRGISFDGSEFINDSTEILIDYPITISAWFRTTDNTKSSILSIASTTVNMYFTLELRVGGTMNYHAKPTAAGNVLSSIVATNDGQWHLATGVSAAANDHKMYLDGILKTSSSTSRAWQAMGKWAVGRLEDTTPDGEFTGDISDARIYATALSAGEIKREYDAGTKSARIRYSTKKKLPLSRTRPR